MQTNPSTPIRFEQCPKYLKHELSEDQIILIAKKAVALAKEDSDKELGRLTKKGFVYVIGAITLGCYTWAITEGLIEVRK